MTQDEKFEYKGYQLQRLTKDMLWYVIINNEIVRHSQYRNDLTDWIDNQIKEKKKNDTA